MSRKATLDEQMKTERHRYMALAFCWADLLFEIRRGVVTFAAGACQPMFGRGPEEIEGRPLAEIVHPSDRNLVSNLLRLVNKLGRIEEATARLLGKDGGEVSVAITGHCLSTAGEGPIFLAVKSRSQSETHDDRDGEHPRLHNLATFPDIAASRLKTLAERGESADLAILEMPGLEELGNRLGAAKAILSRAIGACLRANSLDGDSAAVIAPGKYGVLVGEGGDLEALAAQIASLTKATDPSGIGTAVETGRISVGDAAMIAEEDLVKGVVYALNTFRNSAELNLRDLADSMTILVDKTVTQIGAFKVLVSRSDFTVALQPIVDVRTGRVHHFEALCRFNTGDTGDSPYALISFAEETGLIHRFDLAMARKVVEWLALQPRNNRRYRVAVNVSGYSIGQQEYVDGLMKLLAEHEWTRGRLLFEITESSRMSDLGQANEFIQKLRQLGYEVCLDDFGAGAASFQYLSALEVDAVKLDGSAVHNAQVTIKGRAFLSALTELCRRLNVYTVAEMVDAAESLNFVRECGCDFVQGYLFGKPSTNLEDFYPLPNGKLFKAKRSPVHRW
ncbi:MAG: EAL domain-containing protein [Rhodospirillales bacterium]|nr:EAL domain-containing protein [Rhodospirillales bacterium]